jgi:hypothetical protein
MERIHMNLYREIIYRLRSGQSERAIARDLRLSWPILHNTARRPMLRAT